MKWDEADHPRDPTSGEFVDRIGGWMDRLSAQLGRKYVRGRDLSDELAGESDLTVIARAQGWDALPEIGNKQDLDQAAEAGGVRLWRGAGGSRFAEHLRGLRHGEVGYGGGLYGNGIYATASQDDAEYYATEGWVKDEPPEGSVQAMVVRPDARILKWRVYRESGKVKALRAHADKTGVDMGAAAAAAGYDAIRVIGGHTGAVDDFGEDSSADQWVILNRTAALWEDS